ncbi:MAG: hypothetical protein JWN79_2054 [Gemmatimonadetes bacterium]|jgi:hypothetical protein|nr:hypothetical protein [Gemmatimonadota bacterium]
MNGKILLAALGVLVAVPATAMAQSPRTGRCAYNFAAPNRPLSLNKLPTGNYNIFAGGGVTGTCRSKGLVITADSLEYYGDESRTVLIGRATYTEPRLRLKSNLLTYFETDERVLAVQNVDARLPSGSTIEGPQLEFLRAVPRIRPRQLATAIGRPTINLVERDAQGRAQPPVKVTGNTVWLIGDSVVSAQGSVIVVRPQLTATGDSIYGDAGSGLLRIMRSPRIVGTRGRPFTLVGETIDLITRRRKLEQVLAKSKAEAQSEDLNLKSDTIDMRVTDDLLQRAIVWGRSRAYATSPTQSVVADSIDVLLPGQRVRELRAIRNASAEGMPDTTKFVAKDRDRLTGDTIIAIFDSIPARDTVTRPRIRQLHALGNATSLRSVASSDTTICAPTQIYARGRVIDVQFRAGVVDSVHIVDRDLARGVVAEPTDSMYRCSVLRPVRASAAAGAGAGAAAASGASGQRPGTPPTTPVRAPASTPVALPPTSAPPTRRP